MFPLSSQLGSFDRGRWLMATLPNGRLAQSPRILDPGPTVTIGVT